MEYNKKEELLNKIIELKYVRQGVPENWYNKGVDDSFRYIKNFFNKEFVPEVPQCVADWYEENKYDVDYGVWKEISNKHLNFEYDEKLNYWIENTEDAIITLVKMHLFGYEIEKVPKYTVRMKTLGKYSYLTYHKASDNWNFNEEIQTPTVWSHHTCEELEKAGFSWVFDCEGMEVEEVE